jgi:hypothetical protein
VSDPCPFYGAGAHVLRIEKQESGLLVAVKDAEELESVVLGTEQ